ncbi:4-oxalocrotonate tautomerase family protein [Massilia sp. 9I]|uniref:tautomerase family protein n=1 Tax=Massilia sp. 9I TaxID=2653152 RepID=UPI0012F33323|nr:4-oxalocrotonate tautomerase family protein [Massilia sp. 9I]VXB01166.1 Tautomerase enzyme [Massilia sp. 9I]
MPILTVKVSGRPDRERTHAIAELLLDATSRILKKKRELTAIVIDYVDPDCWLVAGAPLSEHGKSSFYMDIRITDETNTKDEKAAYIREVYAGFARLLGDLHEESYIHVIDARAASYGYGGLTQEYRYHR